MRDAQTAETAEEDVSAGKGGGRDPPRGFQTVPVRVQVSVQIRAVELHSRTVQGASPTQRYVVLQKYGPEFNPLQLYLPYV